MQQNVSNKLNNFIINLKFPQTKTKLLPTQIVFMYSLNKQTNLPKGLYHFLLHYTFYCHIHSHTYTQQLHLHFLLSSENIPGNLKYVFFKSHKIKKYRILLHFLFFLQLLIKTFLFVSICVSFCIVFIYIHICIYQFLLPSGSIFFAIIMNLQHQSFHL